MRAICRRRLLLSFFARANPPRLDSCRRASALRSNSVFGFRILTEDNKNISGKLLQIPASYVSITIMQFLWCLLGIAAAANAVWFVVCYRRNKREDAMNASLKRYVNSHRIGSQEAEQ
jgi:hypothetical protein